MSLAIAPSVLAIAAIAACGGSGNQDLFAPAGSSQFGTEPGSSSGSSGDSVVGSSSSSGASGSSTSSGGSSSSSSSSSSGSSGKDAGTTYTSPGVFCGDDTGTDLYCTGTKKVCCDDSNGATTGSGSGDGPPGFSQFSCVASPTTDCIGGIAIRCDDRTDCTGGQVCCATFDQTFGYQSVQCQAACTTTTPNTTSIRFCDPHAPKDECAEIAKTCTASTSLPGFHYCK